MNTYSECHVSHVCRLLIRMMIKWNRGCVQISWPWPYGWGNPRNITARWPPDDGSATSYYLKWGPLLPRDVVRIALHIREEERKGIVFSLPFRFTCSNSEINPTALATLRFSYLLDSIIQSILGERCNLSFPRREALSTPVIIPI